MLRMDFPRSSCLLDLSVGRIFGKGLAAVVIPKRLCGDSEVDGNGEPLSSIGVA
jgi:hypothetical protein